MTDAVAHLPRVAIDEADVKRIQNGQRITASAECADGALALLGPKGLAAIGRFDLETNTILPKKVFRQSYESDNS
jgi:tRNA U55 pseudouridine synthase TruB